MYLCKLLGIVHWSSMSLYDITLVIWAKEVMCKEFENHFWERYGCNSRHFTAAVLSEF